MTDAQKKAMADGRARAKLARDAKRSISAQETIEQSAPAGHDRSEAIKAAVDQAQQAAEALQANTGAIALDPSKLDVNNVDNEIASKWNPESGDIPFSKPQQGFLYAWVTSENSHGEQARTSIRAMVSRMRRVGWHPVEGDMPEGKEFIGKDCTAGTSHRGVADTELWRIRREEWAKVEDANTRKSLLNMGIEREFVEQAMAAMKGAGRAFDLNDPKMMRAYGMERMKPATYSASFSQEQIRSGTGPLKPGFEIRR